MQFIEQDIFRLLRNPRLWIAVSFLAVLILGVTFSAAVASSPVTADADVVDVLWYVTSIPVVVITVLLQWHSKKNRLPHLNYAAERSHNTDDDDAMRLQAQRHVDAFIGKHHGDSSNTLELEPTGR